SSKNQTYKVVHDRNHRAKRKMQYARMRTLLNESLPPTFDGDHSFSLAQKIPRLRRIFSENSVLATNEPILMEVGVDGTVTATPDAHAPAANSASERGLATLGDAGQLKESPAV